MAIFRPGETSWVSGQELAAIDLWRIIVILPGGDGAANESGSELANPKLVTINWFEE